MQFEGELNLTLTDGADEDTHTFTIDQTTEKFQKLGSYEVAEGATDQELDFTGLIATVEELWLIASKQVTVKFGADTGTPLKFDRFILSKTSVTKLFFTDHLANGDITIDIYAGG